MQTLACFYYPTTAVLIDDDTDFLDSLKLAVAPHFHALSFSSPEVAELFITKNNRDYKNLNHHLYIDYETLSEIRVQIDLPTIHKNIFNPDRFKQAILAIIDFDMPTINGLEIARQIRAKSATKIIMLTGEADQATAVNAFNHQEIDRFIIKNSAGYLNQLTEYFFQLQHTWFVERSQSLIDAIAGNQHPFKDSDFIELFNQIRINYQIVEYYLIDESGTFLIERSKYFVQSIVILAFGSNIPFSQL